MCLCAIAPGLSGEGQGVNQNSPVAGSGGGGLLLAVLCGTLALTANATPYWVAYEGNDFPENEGWERASYGPPPTRYIEDGALVIDSLADLRTADFYYQRLAIDPDPGERFVATWRLLVSETIQPFDVAITIFSDDAWAAAFKLNETTIESVFEDDVGTSFAPGEFHTFEFASDDMRNYELRVDGAPAFEGTFWQGVVESEVNWGDSAQGAASLSKWDYFRFGVVPEPSCLGLMLGTLLLSAKSREV